VELDAGGIRGCRRRGLTMAPVNKVHHVYTIARVAAKTRTGSATSPMKRTTRTVWVYGPGDEGVMAFTDIGIETLMGLIEIYKANPDILKRSTDPL
jgi:hypothetical protein